MKEFAKSELIVNPDHSIYHLHLQKAHLCDVVLAVGDPERVPQVSAHFSKIDSKLQKREFVSHIGSYKGISCLCISTGMGVDNIEIFFNELNALASIDLENRTLLPTKKRLNILRIGTSGTLREELPLGSLLYSNMAIGLDTLPVFYPFEQSVEEADLANAFKQHAELPFLPYAKKPSQRLVDALAGRIQGGLTLTLPGFYAPQGRDLFGNAKAHFLLEKYKSFRHQGYCIDNFEMETAAYYAFGDLYGHDCLSLQTLLANRVSGEFAPNPAKAVEELIEWTFAYLPSIVYP